MKTRGRNGSGILTPMKRSVIVTALFLLCIGLWRGTFRAESSSEVSKVQWSYASFQASKFLNTLTAELTLTSMPAGQAQSHFIPVAVPESDVVPISPSCKEVFHMDLRTTIDPIVGPTVRLDKQVWFCPENADAFQSIWMRLGEDDYKRTFRFTRQGAYRVQREPANQQEAELPSEEWTKIRNSFYPYSLDSWRCKQVSEPSVLIYLVSASPISEGNIPAHFCIFYKRQLHDVRLIPRGSEALEVDYVEKSGENLIRTNGAVKAVRVSLNAASSQADEEDGESFSFLGLKEDIEIFLDPQSRIPLMVRGVIPLAGRVELKLREIRLNKIR